MTNNPIEVIEHMSDKDVLSMREVSARLGMGLRQTYRYARNGDFPFIVRIGTRFVTPKLAFQRWCETAGQQMVDRPEHDTRPEIRDDDQNSSAHSGLNE